MNRAWQRVAESALTAVILAAAVLVGPVAVAGADPPAQTTLTITLGGDGSGAVTTDSGAINCPAALCTATFDPTTSVTLTATPVSGSAFTGFTGGGCAALTCTVLMSADTTVNADFDLVPTITAPADGASYPEPSVPAAAFACAAGDTSCTAMLDATTQISNGDPLSSAAGQHTLTVTGTAADGATVTQTAGYTVLPRPSCGDVAATTMEGASVPVRLQCSDPNAPVTYAIDAAPRHGTLGSPGHVVTYTPDAGFAGTDTFTYHGSSADGSSDPQNATVVVLAPPTAQIAAPTGGQVYTVAQSVPTRFSCSDDPRGPGLRSCTDSGGASDGSGTLDTATEGHHSYMVTATSRDGQTGTASITYTVVGKSPEAVITAPVNNATYLWTALPVADFSCIAGQGSAVQSCKATVGGQPIASGQALPDGFGGHVLTVTATDADGLSSTETATYTVTVSAVSLPPVSIDSPVQGARYRLGQVVAARYSCVATTAGPALTSCVGTVPAGHHVNTRTLGAHTFSVSATNNEGESTTNTVTYKVVPTTNRFVVVDLRTTALGTARVALKLPGPGAVNVVATAWNGAAGASAHRLSYGTARAGARRGGSLLLVVRPTAAGRALLGTHGARPVIALTVTYKPTGAQARVVRPKPLHVD